MMARCVATADRVTLPKKRTVDPRELGRESPAGQPHRKLPPEPGRTPRPSFVPDDEILPNQPSEPRRK